MDETLKLRPRILDDISGVSGVLVESDIPIVTLLELCMKMNRCGYTTLDDISSSPAQCASVVALAFVLG